MSILIHTLKELVNVSGRVVRFLDALVMCLLKIILSSFNMLIFSLFKQFSQLLLIFVWNRSIEKRFFNIEHVFAMVTSHKLSL